MTVLGLNTAGSTTNTSSGNKCVVSPFTPSTSGTVVSGGVYSAIDGGTGNMTVVVYADSSGLPGALLATSDAFAVTNTTLAFNTTTFSGANQINVSSGTQYWIGASWAKPGTQTFTYGRNNTTNQREEQTTNDPNPFGTPSLTSGGPICAYVNYNVASPPGSIFTTISNFNLTLPTGAGGVADTIAQPGLMTYADANFQLNGSNQMVMTSPVNGSTTSGSSATRCEFRELEGGSNADWAMQTTAPRVMTVTAFWDPTGLAGDTQRMIVGQIHGSSGTPPLYLMLDYGASPTPSLGVYVNGPLDAYILTGMTTSTAYTYRIYVGGGQVKLWAVAGPASSLPTSPWQIWNYSDFTDNADCYLKAGAYNKDDSGGSATGSIVTTMTFFNLTQNFVPGITTFSDTTALYKNHLVRASNW